MMVRPARGRRLCRSSRWSWPTGARSIYFGAMNSTETGHSSPGIEKTEAGRLNIMKSFVLNRHGSLVLPANLFAQLDFSVITSLAQFEAIVTRDMESKAPTGTEILES